MAGVQCITSTFGDKPRRMLKVFRRFSKHYSYLTPHYTFTLKMVTETLENLQYSTRLISESRCYMEHGLFMSRYLKISHDRTLTNTYLFGEISGSHGGDYEGCCVAYSQKLTDVSEVLTALRPT
jgi:hypothetical protein